MAKLTVNDNMPNLTVNTITDKDITIKELVSGKPTIFWVLRYIGCTVCRLDVQNLIKRYEEFTNKGLQVIVVMQSDPKVAQESLEGKELPFQLICDTQFEFYNALEIAPAKTMEELLGDSMEKLKAKAAQAESMGIKHGEYEGKEEQLPAMFITNENMQVKYAHYAKNIMDMPTIDEVLQTCETIL